MVRALLKPLAASAVSSSPVPEQLLSARHAFVALESDRAEEIRIKTLPLPIGCLDGLENQMLNNASGRGSRLTPKDGAAGVPPSAIKALFLVSGPVGLRAQDFAPKRWLWRFWVGRPLISWLYRKVAPNLRAVVGAPGTKKLSLTAIGTPSRRLGTCEHSVVAPGASSRFVSFSTREADRARLLLRSSLASARSIASTSPASAAMSSSLAEGSRGADRSSKSSNRHDAQGRRA